MRPRSLVLITIDCLRADHVGFVGPASTTPFLDSLADESFVFHNAIAAGIPTYYALPALLASRYPLALGRDVIGIAPGENTLATELKTSGFNTAAFVAANPYISPAWGYDGGFDVFRDFLNGDAKPIAEKAPAKLRTNGNRILSIACRTLPLLGAAYDELYFRYCQRSAHSRDYSAGNESFDALRQFPSAGVIVDAAISWLNEQFSTPFFLWLHFMDPHAPYYPTEEALAETGHSDISPAEAKYLNSYWARGDVGLERLKNKRDAVVALYDAGIRFVDLQIQRLTQRLIALDRWNDCVMAVTADHGEEFLDHGGRFHAPVKLSEELIRVPLLLRVPGIWARHDSAEPFGMIDLAPTLLDALEIPAPANFRGSSCWRELVANRSWNRPVFTECAYGCTNPFDPEKRLGARLLAVRKGEYKLVMNFASATDELFHLKSDPNELMRLPEKVAKDVRKELLQCAKKHIAKSGQSRDFDLRGAAQVEQFRLSATNSAALGPN